MKILDPESNCSGIYQTTESGLIVDAADYYRLFYYSALQARRYILMTGWQFDSEVRLLRGKDAESAKGEVRLLHFLEQLCMEKPELEIYILAWDFSMVFSLEREWFQDILFNWTTNESIHFRYDNRHAFGATHHQKLVIIDGLLAFVGGMDICSARWDDREHLPYNADRTDDDTLIYGSYHDIQSFHTGPVVAEFLEIFKQRWVNSGAKPLKLPSITGKINYQVDRSLLLATDKVAISRTQAAITEPAEQIREIRQLYLDAVNSAENLIYIENQYFTSQAVYNALVHRMMSPERSRLQIIVMLPDQLPLTEKLFIGIQQMKMIHSLKDIAAATGHYLRVYTTVCIKNEERKMTFIHSKLLLVDDRFLSIGSANITNRSMGLDTELNVSWEEETSMQTPLTESIKNIRVSLLAEHAGLWGKDEGERFRQVEGLAKYLDSLADDPDSRICRYEADASLENHTLQGALKPIARIVDPEENVFEQLTNKNSFIKGVKMISQIITGL